jgi:hypothetical protein
MSIPVFSERVSNLGLVWEYASVINIAYPLEVLLAFLVEEAYPRFLGSACLMGLRLDHPLSQI